MRTSQQLFDKVVKHLRKQGKKSLLGDGGSGCAYHADDGLRCAVGCLITNKAYKEEIEGLSISAVIQKKILPNDLNSDLAANEELLSRLQSIHDRHDMSDWEIAFKEAAEDYKLKYTPPKEVK
jgi:hypothetical protein